MRKFYLFLCATLLWYPVAAQEIDYKGFPQWSWAKKDSTEYLLYTPSDLKPGEKYPVVLFMHGCCGQDDHATLRNAVDPPVRMWHNFGMNTQRIPTYIVAPKTKVGWRQHFESLKAVLDDLIANHQGDPQRVYVSGFSMGGAGTWEMIEIYPGFFAAALPMGMDFRGREFRNYQTIPIWTNRGQTDWWSRHLGSQVAAIRELNGWARDSSSWPTGVNPRLTTFAGVGHGVMWDAASSQDLVGWAYSQVNDGNQVPTVYFKTPQYNAWVDAGTLFPIEIQATDADGSILRVAVYLNGKLVKSLKDPPYRTTVKLPGGDSRIQAIALDDRGKKATETIVVHTPLPVTIKGRRLVVKRGAYYETQIVALGNGKIRCALVHPGDLPEGLNLSTEGILSGIAVRAGQYTLRILAEDEDGDRGEGIFPLSVLEKSPQEVIVTNVRNYAGKSFPVSKVRIGTSPHEGSSGDEVTFSGGLDAYAGLTFIQTAAIDTVDAGLHYLEFDVDEDVTVYVAYEKRDHLYTSTIPDWLKTFRKEAGGQVVAQYFYYEVYAKEFAKGKVILPDAQEEANAVNRNYFVMLRKK